MNHDDNDPDLFRDAVGPVRRVRSTRVESRPRSVEATPRMRHADETQVMRELAEAGPIDPEAETGEELLWHRPGIQKRILVRLRRGHWSVQDEIDLHRMNAEAAERSIRTFIDEALSRDMRCVKIIHGKGLRSGPGGPRLKTVTARLLRRDPNVIAYASAPAHDGGTGAVYALLKKPR